MLQYAEFWTLDERWEAFYPDEYPREIVKKFKGWPCHGEVELAQLKLPNGRVVEQRGTVASGFQDGRPTHRVRYDYREVKAPPKKAKAAGTVRLDESAIADKLAEAGHELAAAFVRHFRRGTNKVNVVRDQSGN